MMVEKYKEQLRELHDRIMQNSFRRDEESNSKYGKGYFDTVYRLAQTFDCLIKDIQKGWLDDVIDEDEKLAKATEECQFIHNFYGCVNRSSSAIICFNDLGKYEALEALHEESELVELCIYCIHCYIDTGCFNRYPLISHGSIKLASWNNERNQYEII